MLPSEPAQGKALRPIWSLGFRPFFIAGSTFAVLSISLWAALLSGWLNDWQPNGGSLAWHRHEMLFGFAGAIIAGFLLTAVQSWTGHKSLQGRPLVMLFIAWLAARLAWLFVLPFSVLILLQLVFFPLLAGIIAVQLYAVRQRHNYPIVLVLILMSLFQAQALYGLALADDALQRRGALAALWLLAALIGLIGGRVIPLVTLRDLGLSAPIKSPRLNNLGLTCALVVAGLTAAGGNQVPHSGLALLFLLIACLHGLRLWRWYKPGIWRAPLLWSLHLAYAWLALAALGMAAWHLGLLSQPSLATHAMAVGGIGGLILTMLVRISLGRTGRPLQPPAAINWAIATLLFGAFSRVLLVAVAPSALWLAALAWVITFLVFLRHYAPLLCQARPDGQPD